VTRTAGKMICPRCKVEMNHHGDKVVYPDPQNLASVDAQSGGVIEEFHTCPNCGEGASRPA
jgi:ribosomal protein S27AE